MKRIEIYLFFLVIVCFCFSCKKEVKSSVNLPKISSDYLVGNIPCKFPLVDNQTELNYFIVGYDDVQAQDVFVWQKYQEATGVKINWITERKPKVKERVHIILSNKQDVDLILRTKLSSRQLSEYGENGYILNLMQDELLKKNAPNCWAYLQNHPTALASVLNPNGTLYALPQINSGAELRVARKIFINKHWLKNVNMPVPRTTEEFYQVLKAFKTQDANGNGDPNDEIPFCTQDWVSLQDVLLGAFGLGNRGVHNLFIDCDEKTNKVRLIASTDEYKNFLKYLNRLYSEELLDNSIFTITINQWLNSAKMDRIGIFANTNLATLPLDKTNNFIAVEEALEGPEGYKMWAPIRANFHSTGAAFIPSTCKNSELVLQWLDYFWTDEGTLFYHMGIENETFVKENNAYDYIPSIYQEMKNTEQSFDDIIALYSPYPGGGNPTVEIAPYFKGGEMATVPATAAKKLFTYGPKEYWPNFTFTLEEIESLTLIESDINKFIESMRINFITGKISFDEWDEYLDQLSILKQEEILRIYQLAVDRYYSLIDSL